MSLNLLICDDSGFARKQMAKSLPPDWNVDIHFATDGVEGIEAIREGKGDIVLLDLTMPNMDGFGVLEIIRREDLPAMVIVVSGDIQPEARKRVLDLGALAFIEKPIDTDKARKVLTEYGILTGI